MYELLVAVYQWRFQGLRFRVGVSVKGLVAGPEHLADIVLAQAVHEVDETVITKWGVVTSVSYGTRLHHTERS